MPWDSISVLVARNREPIHLLLLSPRMRLTSGVPMPSGVAARRSSRSSPLPQLKTSARRADSVSVPSFRDRNAVPPSPRNPAGPENGDLPNLYAAADGSVRAEFFTTRVSISGGAAPALLDENGSAVIIHEHPDDHMIQPNGGAGGRIRCGIISKM